MRFVWAVAAFVLAALLIGAGIAQRTIFHGPDVQTASVESDQDTAYIVVDGAAMSALPGTQTLRAEGTGPVFVAYGLTRDVQAWVSATEYTQVTLSDEAALVSSLVEPTVVEEVTQEAETDAAAESEETDQTVFVTPSPVDADIWLDEFQQEDVLTTPLQIPTNMSVIVAADGSEPAPAVSVSWRVAQQTPWAGPLMVLGGLTLIGGIILYVLAIRHHRRSRGPRRKSPPPLEQTQPIDVAVEGSKKKAIGSSTRRSRRGRAFIALPVVTIAAVALAGCSAESWPDLAPSPTPSPTATVIDADDQQLPAVTEGQAQRILEEISASVAEADSNADAEVAATRLEGAALAARQTNYTLRGEIADYPAPAAIATDPLSIILPQAYDGWPRDVMLVVGDEDDTDPAPTIMMMTQEDPWSDYKLSYIAAIEAATEMPELAPAYVGAAQVPPDSSFLVIAPEELSAAYADVLTNGDDSEYAALFDSESDQFREMIAADRQRRLDEFNETAADTGTLSFSAEGSDDEPLSLATLESGAIVAVTVNELDTVKPSNDDAVIKLDNNPTVRTLSGEEESATGFTTTFADQLFFYVPGQGSSETIRLLGYSSNILDAKAIS